MSTLRIQVAHDFSGCLKIGTSAWYLYCSVAMYTLIYNIPKQWVKISQCECNGNSQYWHKFPNADNNHIFMYTQLFFYDSTLQLVLIWDKDQCICPKMIPVLLPRNIFYNYSGTPLKRTPLGPPLCVRHMEVSVIQGFWYTSSRQGNVFSGCWAWRGCTFRFLCCHTMLRLDG